MTRTMKISTLLKKFEDAVRLDEMAGGQHPLEMDAIREWFPKVKKVILEKMDFACKWGLTTCTVDLPEMEEITHEQVEEFENECERRANLRIKKGQIMGCDIHVHVEIKVNNTWHLLNAPDCRRWYWLFSRICGVRAQGDGTVPLTEILDKFPDDISVGTKVCLEYWDGDAHSLCILDSQRVIQLETELDALDPMRLTPYFGYFFGNNFSTESRPDSIQDFRFVIWFDN